MFEQQRHLCHQTLFTLCATGIVFTGNAGAAFAKDPIEAAQDLASLGQTDPNGLTLMIVSICMLFVFALTIIIAISVQAFKKKPARTGVRTQVQGRKEPSTVA